MAQDSTAAKWTIDVFQDKDAPGVAALYRLIYGDHFPLAGVYDPEWHISQARNKDSARVVVRSPDDSVIATGALFRSVPGNPDLYEGGGLLVKDEYRTENLPLHLMEWLCNRLPALFNINQIWGEAVCNHIVTQQLSIKSGQMACALEVESMPARAYERLASRGQDIQGRVSALVVYKEFAPRPRRLFLPGNYAGSLAAIYAPFGFELELQDPGAWSPGGPSQGHAEGYSASGLVRVSLQHAGSDFKAWLAEVEARKFSADPAGPEDENHVWQVILPLGQPWAGYATAILNDAGYWLGGIMPSWFGEDGLLLQKTSSQPDFSRIRLYSRPAKSLLQLVQNDFNEKGC